MEQGVGKPEQDQPGEEGERLLGEVRELQDLVASLPDRDKRAPEEIIGYDEFGLPG